jgi:hypothetical protein
VYGQVGDAQLRATQQIATRQFRTASYQVALLTLEALLRVGLPAAAKGFSTLKGRLRGRRCDVVTYL